jgi:hypothetical protein
MYIDMRKTTGERRRRKGASKRENRFCFESELAVL